MIAYGANPIEFSMLVQRTFYNFQKSKEFIQLLRELWIECNVIRRAGVWVRLTFADRISKADWCDSLSDDSKLARSLIPIDLMQSKSLRNHTQGKISRIENSIEFFIEREALRQ